MLADPGCLEAERDAVEAWLRGGGSAQAVLVAVADPADGDERAAPLPLRRRPARAAGDPGAPALQARAGLEALHNRRVDPPAREALSRKGDELSELNKIGVALSAERDINKLLELILSKSREITAADAGSLYLVERGKDGSNGKRRPAALQADPERLACPCRFEESTMPLDETSIAGYVALTGER